MRAARTIPLRPMLVPPAATACQECAEVPGTQQAVVNPAVGTTQETSPTSVEPVPTSGRCDRPRAASVSRGGSGVSARVLRISRGELGLALVVLQVVEPHRGSSATTRPSTGLGRISTMPPRYCGLQPRLGGQRAGLGTLDQPGIERLHDLGLRVADVVEDLGEIGDDVGRLAAGRDDVVDPREVRRMLAEQLGRVVGQLDGVERRSARFGGRGGVRAGAVEPELGGDPRLARDVAGRRSRSTGASAARRRSRRRGGRGP